MPEGIVSRNTAAVHLYFDTGQVARGEIMTLNAICIGCPSTAWQG